MVKMGWHPCCVCGSQDWEVHEKPKGCNICSFEIQSDMTTGGMSSFSRQDNRNVEKKDSMT